MSKEVDCWRTLGVVFGLLEVLVPCHKNAPNEKNGPQWLLGTLLGGLGGSLGTFFGIWAAPWATFSDIGGSLGDLVAPNGSQN